MQEIPKLIHYVWVGGKPLPQRFQTNIESWIEHNPEFKVMLWNEDNFDFSSDYLRVALLQKRWALVADFIRLSVLKQYGGIYLDTDVFVLKSFQPLLASKCFMGFQEDRYVNNAAIGAIPNHWLISRLYQHYLELGSIPDDADIAALGFGPSVVNKILSEEELLISTTEIFESRDVTLFPSRYFYPYNWNEDFSERCITPDTYAIHFWELSWHLEQRGWFRRQVTSFLKSNPTIYRNAKRTIRSLRSVLKVI